MPTILRINAYRFFFYAGDKDEPLHIHVERDNYNAKFWLAPIRLQYSHGFGRNELQRIQRLIETHQRQLFARMGGIFL